MSILKELKSKLALIEEKIKVNTILAMSSTKESELFYQSKIEALEKEKAEVSNKILAMTELSKEVKTN